MRNGKGDDLNDLPYSDESSGEKRAPTKKSKGDKKATRRPPTPSSPSDSESEPRKPAKSTSTTVKPVITAKKPKPKPRPQAGDSDSDSNPPPLARQYGARSKKGKAGRELQDITRDRTVDYESEPSQAKKDKGKGKAKATAESSGYYLEEGQRVPKGHDALSDEEALLEAINRSKIDTHGDAGNVAVLSLIKVTSSTHLQVPAVSQGRLRGHQVSCFQINPSQLLRGFLFDSGRVRQYVSLCFIAHDTKR
jgi:hypothetical protein